MADCVPGTTVGGCYTDADGGVTNVVDASRGLIYQEGIKVAHRRLEGTSIRQDAPVPLLMAQVPQDLRRAWRDGWTGKGVNMLIVDFFGDPEYGPAEVGHHGHIITASAFNIAPAANYYTLEIRILPSNDGSPRRASDNTGGGQYQNLRFDVVNGSFLPPMGLIDPDNPMNVLHPVTGQPFTPEELAAEQQIELKNATELDITGQSNTFPNIGDAVVVRPAGNAARAISHPGEFMGLILREWDTSITSRILVVGAITGNSDTGDAELAVYSNYPGAGALYQGNFLVEYADSPGFDGLRLCDITSTEMCNNEWRREAHILSGTSLSAPRVAGYATLVRHKFPGLSGVQTAKILLDTAIYEGLVCHPNCDVERYGQGRVGILDALSPIGKLK